MNDLALALIPLFCVAAGFLLLVPAPLFSAHRMQASTLVLALLLATGFVQLVWLNAPVSIDLPLAMMASVLVAAPLLERARFMGLGVAALVASSAGLYAMGHVLPNHLPAMSPLAMLPLAIVMALLTGLLGGMKLPLHPRRLLPSGVAVWHSAPQGVMLAGWVGILLALGSLVWIIDRSALALPQLAALLVGGLASLLQAHHQGRDDSLQKAGEGMVAGFMVALLAPLSPMVGAALGLLAAFCVARGEALALALRLADPHHFIGALLLPCMLGVIVPGIVALPLLATQLQWLGATLALALVMTALLWPIVMFFFGVALPPRLVREGVHR